MPIPLENGSAYTAQGGRRRAMLARITAERFATVEALADRFGVSQVTVRSDISALADAGAVHKIRGGAVSLDDDPVNPSYEARLPHAWEDKEAIAHRTWELVRGGHSVVLDSGTTAMAVARCIVQDETLSEFTVFTHALNIALALEQAHPRVRVVVTGGTLSSDQHTLVQPLADHILRGVSADFAVIGANGVHSDGGVSTFAASEAEIKRLMMKAGRRTIVMADASKLDQRSLIAFAVAGEIDQIITAGPAGAGVIDDLVAHGFQILDATGTPTDVRFSTRLLGHSKRTPTGMPLRHTGPYGPKED